MDNILLITHTFASLIALCFSYASVMFVLKKEPTVLLLRKIVITTAFTTIVAVGLGVSYFMNTSGALANLSFIVLLFALANILGGLYIIFKVQNNDFGATAGMLKTTLCIACGSLIVHLLLLIAAIAWS